MKYSVNPSVFKSIFAVPSDIVDKHIRLANEHQLKVLLWILRTSPDNPDIDSMCKALKINKNDAADYLQYWILTGVINCDDSDKATSVEQLGTDEKINISDSKSVAEIHNKNITALPSKPSSSEIVARLDESPEIGHLFNEAQIKLGRTIGYDGQSVLIMLYDSYGLPVEVILMAVEYAVSQGKASFSNIARIGKKWSELEIDTLEGAMEYIEEHNVVNEVWHKLRLLTDITNKRPTQKQFGYLTAWIKEYGYDANMIFYAYEECVDRTGKMSMPYMDKIITAWHKNGVKTPLDIEEERKRWKESRAKASTKKEKDKPDHEKREASYDIDRFLKKSVDLVYDKNDKNA